MREFAVVIDRNAVQRDPALDADANGCDLVLASGALAGPAHPHAYAIPAPLTRYPKVRQRAHDPFFEIVNETAHVPPAAVQVEHRINDALSGAVIGELAAAPAGMHRKPCRKHLLPLCARSRRVKRRMLEEPDELRAFACRNRGDPRLHGCNRALIAYEIAADAPLDRRCRR